MNRPDETARAFLIALMLGSASLASAAPVIGPGGKPGAAASWKSAGGGLTLKCAKGFDAAAVAEAIRKHVKSASVKTEGDNITITGLPEAELLKALETVDVPEGDDVDGLLSQLHNQGGGEEGSGSSIRATKSADFSELMGKKDELITAKVVDVKRAQFPLVFVTVKLGQVPKSAAPEGLKPGATITVLPRVKSRQGVVDPSDETSKLNVGAWYAQPGDTVLLRLEKGPPKDKVWVAAAFDRRVK